MFPVFASFSFLIAILAFVLSDAFYLTSVLISFAPWGLLLFLVLAVWASLKKRVGIAFSACAIWVVLFTLVGHTLTRALSHSQIAAQSTHIVSLSNRTLNDDMTALADLARTIEADVFALQEVNDPEAFWDLFSESGQWNKCEIGHLMIASVYPVGLPTEESTLNRLFCEVVLPSGTATIASVHVPKTTLDGRALHEKEVAELIRITKAREMPVVIAGDFNTTALTTPYRELTDVLRNAFDDVGRGFGFTFPTPARRIGLLGPLVRIDHVFASNEFTFVDAKVLKVHTKIADHYPISVRWTMP